MPYKRYTPNGYSFEFIKKRARKIALERGISLTKARNLAALEIGYKNWAELYRKDKNPERDAFFHRGFSDREWHHDTYKIYLDTHRLEHTPKIYREYLVSSYEAQESLIKDRIRLHPREINIESFIKEFHTRQNNLGPESLLPQNLPDYLLYKTSDILNRFLADPAGSTQDSDGIHQVKVIQEGIVQLITAREFIKKTEPLKKLDIDQKEFIQCMQYYAAHLTLEILSRDNKIKISKPTIETIFDSEHNISAEFPESFLKPPRSNHTAK